MSNHEITSHDVFPIVAYNAELGAIELIDTSGGIHIIPVHIAYEYCRDLLGRALTES